MYDRCATCHHDGGQAFSLMNYQAARPWAKAIKEEVLERRMPPFAAVKGFGPVKEENALTQEEMHLVADWVEGGARRKATIRNCCPRCLSSILRQRPRT